MQYGFANPLILGKPEPMMAFLKAMNMKWRPGTDRVERVRVSLRPAASDDNPYCHLLAQALINEGLAVANLKPGLRHLPRDRRVVILHWPNEFFFARNVKSIVRSYVLIAFMIILQKLFKQRYIWIVHNIEPHDRTGISLPLLKRAFFHMLDGMIFLSNTSRYKLVEKNPALTHKPFIVTVHGHYKDCALMEAYPLAALDGGPVNLAFAGRIEYYKQPEKLAILASGLSNANLIIAGRCTDKALLKNLIQIAHSANNIILRPEFLSASELEHIVDRSSAIIMPYRDIMNSGSALFALSRARPFIAPRIGSLIELQQQVGADWVWLYDGELNKEILESAICWLNERERNTMPDLSCFDWDVIGHSISSFVRDSNVGV